MTPLPAATVIHTDGGRLLPPRPHQLVTLSSVPVVSVVPRSGPGQLLLRSLLLGVASGCRSSLGAAGPVASTPRSGGHLDNRLFGRGGTIAAGLMVGGELIADKLPMTPSRLDRRALPARFLSGAGGGATLARREGHPLVLAAALGASGSAVGAYGGFAWRKWAGARRPDWQAALLEDGVALGLATAACLPCRRG